MIPLVQFSPDADPTSKGTIVDAGNIVPTDYGMRGAPTAVSLGVNALAAACVGAAQLVTLSGTKRIYAGTATKLYELSGTTWTDRSRAGNYTLGSEGRWKFAQYGDSTLAANESQVLQRSTGAAFADIAGSPQAKIVVSTGGFAVAFNTTASSDTWYCSAYLDETDWTLDVTTQCVTGRIVQVAGPITAAEVLGDDIIAYKAGAMYIGRYQGAPAVWQWTQISSDIGCVGIDAVAKIPQGHIFVGKDNVYLYDGSYPRPIASGVLRRWLLSNMAQAYASKTTILWDRDRQLVWIYFVGTGSTALNRCVVYHPPSGRWGTADSSIEAVVLYTTPAITYDGGTGLVTTYDSGPAIPFDSPLWNAGSESPAVFNTSHVMCSLSGACSSAYFVTGDFGDDQGYTFCDEVRVRYTDAPTTSTATGFVKDESGAITVAQQSQAVDDGCHDMRQAGRFHRFRIDTTGDFEFTGIRPAVKPAGRR